MGQPFAWSSFVGPSLRRGPFNPNSERQGGGVGSPSAGRPGAWRVSDIGRVNLIVDRLIHFGKQI